MSLPPTSRIIYDVVTGCILSTFVFTRYYIVHVLNRRKRPNGTGPGWSTISCDIFIGISWILCVFVGVVDIRSRVWQMKYADPKWAPYMTRLQVPTWHAKTMLQGYVFTDFAYLMVLWSIKACFLSIYISVSDKVSPLLRYYIYFCSCTIFIVFSVLMTTTGFWCRPISNTWTLGPNFCSTTQTLTYAIIVLSLHLSTDLLILSISILTLLTLTLGKRERQSIIFVVFLGSTTMVATSVRFYFTYRLKSTTSESEKNFLFPSGVYLATTAEGVIGVITACLPSFKALIRNWIDEKEDRRVAAAGDRMSRLTMQSVKVRDSRTPSPWSVGGVSNYPRGMEVPPGQGLAGNPLGYEERWDVVRVV